MTRMIVRLNQNPWSLPGPPIYVEGKPSPEKIEADIAKAESLRREWRPGNNAFELLDRLRLFSGHDVEIFAWDPLMIWLEEEGPYPIHATCLGIKTMTNSEGLLRAFLVIDNPVSIPTPDGYDDIASLVPDGGAWLFDIENLYAIAARQP